MAEQSLDKQARLAQRLQQARRRRSGHTISRRPPSDKIPLSVTQNRFWFLNQFDPNDPAHHRPMALRLQGELDIETLRQSLTEIIRRHEILRATFPTVGGQPDQVILAEPDFQLPLIDLSQVSPAEREKEAANLAAEESQKPFNLAQGPLIRGQLFHLGDAEHLLLLVMHHMLCDGWSARIFVKEIASLYEAFSTGQESPLPDLPLQYADFAYWQQEQLAQGVWEAQRTFWQETLARAPETLNLPADHLRPAAQTSRGATQYLDLPSQKVKALSNLGRQENATLFMMLLAAFKILLYRYTGQEDLVVGCPISGRAYPELEPLIGFFVNTLPLRADLSGNPPFREVLQRVRKTALEAYSRQDLPLDEIFSTLNVKRDLSYSPLFQVLFTLENLEETTVETPTLWIEEFEFDSGIAPYDLTLEILTQADGLKVKFIYNIDLFNDETITRMMGHFQTLLNGILIDPGRPIVDLPLLTPAERQQLLVTWNDTKTDYPRDACIHQLFEAQVRQTPDAVAVVFGGRELTYRELNERANRLAHYLQRSGVGPEVLVGICVERSLEMMVGLLGILKAGGAYLPLTPIYPQEQLAFMLEDAQVSVLLTQDRLLNKLPDSGQTFCLDTEWDALSGESIANPESAATADNLAYVMYTSGSSGRPKGVSIIHRNVVRLVKETNYMSFSNEQVFLQLASISFDASTFEIWGALLNGAKLVVAPPHTLTLEEIGQAIAFHKVTTLLLTTGLFHLMVDERPDDLKPLHQLLTGGDVLPVSHGQRVVQKAPNCRLINVYGPTENTTFTCCFSVNHEDVFRQSVPIGPPIANTQVYILDSRLQPTPIGVVGELYAGGDGVARGYHNRPELSQEKFISHPFGEGRLYRTGDLARYLPDGNIEFLGRLDNQVKIRGFRVEPGEIEAVLSQYPAVRKTVVIAQEDGSIGKRLVAYIVVDQDHPSKDSDLRNFLKQKLPDYMIPARFVIIDELPLTPNGKVDRRALPEPAYLSSNQGEAVEPRTAIEKTLLEIWIEILGIEKIDPHDNFFELGGHSLKAVQAVSRLRDVFGVDLSLRSFFESPTIVTLAAEIERVKALETQQSQRDGETDTLDDMLRRLGEI